MLRVGGRHSRRLTSSFLLTSARKRHYPTRWYSTTLPKLSEAEIEDDDNDETSSPPKPNLNPKQLATAYAQRRNAYRKAVTSLRKQYAAEYESRRAKDEAVIQKQREQLTRKRLERQRLKNIRSARNAALEEMKRLERAREFELELQEAQVKRDGQKARLDKARKLILEELEAECCDWLVTAEEVGAVFDPPEASQELWSRPGMYVGAPPSFSADFGGDVVDGDLLPDAQFWRYESHTWATPKTFPTMKEVFLEETNEETYLGTNIDNGYWNEERTRKRLELEDRAKLRAMVREEGRKVLLKKQRDWMQGRYGAGADVGMGRRGQMHHHGKGNEIPEPMPAPKLDVLADYEAMEREGVKVLMKDPTKFFVFEDNDDGNAAVAGVDSEGEESEGTADRGGQRTSLGRPIRLRDPLRDNPLHPGAPYPVIVGKEPRPDLRTEREKKRAEREEKMRAAAAASGDSNDKSDDIALAADDDAVAGEKFDYDEAYREMDIENKEWEEGLDPVEDELVLQTPRSSRLSETDVDWVLEQMNKRAEFIKEELLLESVASETIGQEGGGTAPGERAKELIEKVVKEASLPTTSLDKRSKSFNPLDYIDEHDTISDREALAELGLGDIAELEAIEAVLDTLTKEQRDAIEELDTGSDDGEEGGLSREDIAEALQKVPGLSEEQVNSLIELELSMAENKELCERLSEAEKEG